MCNEDNSKKEISLLEVMNGFANCSRKLGAYAGKINIDKNKLNLNNNMSIKSYIDFSEMGNVTPVKLISMEDKMDIFLNKQREINELISIKQNEHLLEGLEGMFMHELKDILSNIDGNISNIDDKTKLNLKNLAEKYAIEFLSNPTSIVTFISYFINKLS